MRLRRLAPLAVLVLAAAVGAASASVSIPTTGLPLSATGEDIFGPEVAVDPSGNAFHAWVRDEPGAGTLKFIQAVRVSAAGTVGTVHTVSTPGRGSSSPAIAASPDGTAIVVWQEFQNMSADRQIFSARINADGSLGSTVPISNISDDAISPDVGIDGTGKALVVWNDLSGFDTIEARTLTGTSLGQLEDAASSAANFDADNPDVAVAPVGVAILTFHRRGALEEVHFKRRLTDGTWEDENLGAGVSAGSIAGVMDSPQVAVDPAGDTDAVVTWREDTGSNVQTMARRIESTETDTLAGPIRTLSAAGQDADQPQVDMDGAGNAYLTWRRSNGTVTVPQMRTMATNSALGTTANLNPSGTANGDQPQVAADEAGNATFVWRFGLNIETRGLPVGGSLTAIQPLTTTGSNTEPRVDVNASGARWGAYRLDTAGNDRAFGFFDPTLPGFVPPPPDPPPPGPGPGAGDATPTQPGTPAAKKCKKGQKLKKGKCVKKKRKKK